MNPGQRVENLGFIIEKSNPVFGTRLKEEFKGGSEQSIKVQRIVIETQQFWGGGGVVCDDKHPHVSKTMIDDFLSGQVSLS